MHLLTPSIALFFYFFLLLPFARFAQAHFDQATVETGGSPVSGAAASATSSSPWTVNTAALDTLADNCFASHGCERLYYLFDDAFGTWSPAAGGYPASQVPKLKSAICDGSLDATDPWAECDACMSSMATMLGIGGSPITSIHDARLAETQLCSSDSGDSSAALDKLLTTWDVFSNFWIFIARYEASSSLSVPSSSASSPPVGVSSFHSSNTASLSSSTLSLLTIPLTTPPTSSSPASSTQASASTPASTSAPSLSSSSSPSLTTTMAMTTMQSGGFTAPSGSAGNTPPASSATTAQPSVARSSASHLLAMLPSSITYLVTPLMLCHLLL